MATRTSPIKKPQVLVFKDLEVVLGTAKKYDGGDGWDRTTGLGVMNPTL
jgi:hypothetical protein